MGLFTRKARRGRAVSNAAELEHKKWVEDLGRRVVTERTLSWEKHKATLYSHLLRGEEKRQHELAEGFGLDPDFEAFMGSIEAEVATFEQREQEMRTNGEIR